MSENLVPAEFIGGPRCGELHMLPSGTYEHRLSAVAALAPFSFCTRPENLQASSLDILTGTYRYDAPLSVRFYGVDTEGTRRNIFVWRGWE